MKDFLESELKNESLNVNFKIEVKFEDTTCSWKSFKMGSGQKVLSYTYFEGPTYDQLDRNYLAGVEYVFLFE